MHLHEFSNLLVVCEEGQLVAQLPCELHTNLVKVLHLQQVTSNLQALLRHCKFKFPLGLRNVEILHALSLKEPTQIFEESGAHRRTEELSLSSLAGWVELQHLKLRFLKREVFLFLLLTISFSTSDPDLANLMLSFCGTLSSSSILLFFNLFVDLGLTVSELFLDFRL